MTFGRLRVSPDNRSAQKTAGNLPHSAAAAWLSALTAWELAEREGLGAKSLCRAAPRRRS